MQRLSDPHVRKAFDRYPHRRVLVEIYIRKEAILQKASRPLKADELMLEVELHELSALIEFLLSGMEADIRMIEGEDPEFSDE